MQRQLQQAIHHRLHSRRPNNRHLPNIPRTIRHQRHRQLQRMGPTNFNQVQATPQSPADPKRPQPRRSCRHRWPCEGDGRNAVTAARTFISSLTQSTKLPPQHRTNRTHQRYNIQQPLTRQARRQFTHTVQVIQFQHVQRPPSPSHPRPQFQ